MSTTFFGLSEDIACALIARTELRKSGLSVTTSPGEFNTVFHDFLDSKKGVSDADRKRRIASYLENSELAIKKPITVKDKETGIEKTELTIVGLVKE
jgi:hypothetical protein